MSKPIILLFAFLLLACNKDDKGSSSQGKHIAIPSECNFFFPFNRVTPGKSSFYLFEDEDSFSKDSTKFMECYMRYNGKRNIVCEESEFNTYSVCAVLYPKLFGIPEECIDFVVQEDSIAYHRCCKRHNACWMTWVY